MEPAMPSPTCGGTAHVLPNERAGASFDIAELQKMMGSGSRREAIDKIKGLFTGPAFEDQDMDHYLSYTDLFEKQAERATEATKILRTNPEFRKYHQKDRKLNMADLFNTGSMGIHFVAFLPFLETQANDEQKKKWLSGARNLEYFGAYAQTELGHGSNVRGLETTATYDVDTDEFVIHSPTLSSIKWWPTGMYAATHGIVFAQLISKGKNYGYNSFMVQFRDDQGNLMPGVEVGEIGPKIVPRITNIGYARFTHVRVPRFNMFSRTQQITREGEYIAAPPKLSKFKYIGMMTIRMGMVGGAYSSIANATTVAVRYLCIRRQGFKDSTAEDALSSGENVVLDYQFHQYRVFKALALAYCLFSSSRYVSEFLASVRDGIMAGDESAADELPELHATLAGMKTYCTFTANEQCEAMRKSCGGQGFLRASGVADLSIATTEAVTAEGEHVILAFQTARFLMKAARQARAGEELAGSVSYLKEKPLSVIDSGALGPSANAAAVRELALVMLRDRARRFAEKLETSFASRTSAGATFDEALNKNQVLAFKASECHTVYVLARNQLEVMSRTSPEGPCREALLRLFELMALQQIYEHAGDFIGVLTDADPVLDRINLLLEQIRPDAVALTDGFGITDWNLKSTLGGYDGNVYEAIYGEAKKGPLNQTSRMVGWDHYSQILDLDFLREGMSQQRQGENLLGKDQVNVMQDSSLTPVGVRSKI